MSNDFDEDSQRPSYDWRIALIAILALALIVTVAAQNGVYDGSTSPFQSPQLESSDAPTD